MKVLLLNFLLICVFNAQVNSKYINIKCENIEGHYWRDYTGTIPSDALPAGFDTATNLPTYIGLTMDKEHGLLIPGEIDAKAKLIRYEYNAGAYTETIDVKILCTGQPENYQWIKANKDDEIYKILGENMGLVVGAHENSLPIYIGREVNEKRITVGKVTSKNNKFIKLHLSANGREESVRLSYEVLTYNPVKLMPKGSTTINVNIFQ